MSLTKDCYMYVVTWMGHTCFEIYEVKIATPHR